jgi:hypothetical protein
MDYQADQAKHGGGRGLWHVTHNSYTEVSSECGLVALAFYGSALVLTYRSLRRSGKAGSTEAAFLVVMQVGFGICMLFLSMAYNIHMLVLSGLAMALENRLPVPVSESNQELTSSSVATPTRVPA